MLDSIPVPYHYTKEKLLEINEIMCTGRSFPKISKLTHLQYDKKQLHNLTFQNEGGCKRLKSFQRGHIGVPFSTLHRPLCHSFWSSRVAVLSGFNFTFSHLQDCQDLPGLQPRGSEGNLQVFLIINFMSIPKNNRFLIAC